MVQTKRTTVTKNISACITTSQKVFEPIEKLRSGYRSSFSTRLIAAFYSKKVFSLSFHRPAPPPVSGIRVFLLFSICFTDPSGRLVEIEREREFRPLSRSDHPGTSIFCPCSARQGRSRNSMVYCSVTEKNARDGNVAQGEFLLVKVSPVQIAWVFQVVSSFVVCR